MMIGKDDKIWVTGCTGLVGSYIVRALLRAGYIQLICNRRSTSKMSHVKDFSDQVDWTEIDLTSSYDVFEQVGKVDIVIHAAALVSFNPSDQDSLITMNVDVTRDLVNAGIEHGLKKFIFISSVAALGKRKDGKTIDEQSEWKDSPLNSPYGISKKRGELEVWRGAQEGLEVVILNPSYILGTGIWGQSSLRLYTDIMKGNRFYPMGTNGFVDVRDVAQAAVIAMDKNIVNDNYIISAENLSYQAVMEIMTKVMDIDPPQKPLTPRLRSMYYWYKKITSLLTFKRSSITRSTLESLSLTSHYSNQKSIDALGMKYRNIPKTLKDTTEKFLAEDETPLPLNK